MQRLLLQPDRLAPPASAASPPVPPGGRRWIASGTPVKSSCFSSSPCRLRAFGSGPSPAAPARAERLAALGRVADVDAARVRGDDRRSVRVGRVRRDHERGLRPDRPDGPRAGLRDLELAARSPERRPGRRRRSWSPVGISSSRTSSGIHAAIADATYSGGFAATGGAVVLRPIGGEPVDAVGWGDATSAFVEGVAAPAPASGSSIERLPGGSLGNGTDTNDNASDFVVRTPPFPQNLAAAPTPVPAPTPTPARH